MELKNYMEDIVWQSLEELLAAQPDVCKCQKCRYDIMALALNFLPPRYVVTEAGETFTRIKSLEQQFSVDVITAITNAIILVASRPHHYEEREA
ncbi:MAG: late competence development ComFB family protein [Pelosinus sp.]|nr:late competence development ComFB family protein [Pelosinus sp.]